jgi:hypothetical protein
LEHFSWNHILRDEKLFEKLTTQFSAHPSKGWALHAYRNGKHVHNTLDHLRSFTLIMLEVCKKVPEKNHRM